MYVFLLFPVCDDYDCDKSYCSVHDPWIPGPLDESLRWDQDLTILYWCTSTNTSYSEDILHYECWQGSVWRVYTQDWSIQGRSGAERKFTTNNALTVHLRIHTREKPFAFEHCSIAFRTTHELTLESNHISIHIVKRYLKPTLHYSVITHSHRRQTLQYCSKAFTTSTYSFVTSFENSPRKPELKWRSCDLTKYLRTHTVT